MVTVSATLAGMAGARSTPAACHIRATTAGRTRSEPGAHGQTKMMTTYAIGLWLKSLTENFAFWERAPDIYRLVRQNRSIYLHQAEWLASLQNSSDS